MKENKQFIKIESLVDNDDSLQIYSVDTIEDLVTIKDIGVTTPIIIDQNNVIIDGYRRVKACKEFGVKTIPYVIGENNMETVLSSNQHREKKYSHKLREVKEWKTIYAAMGKENQKRGGKGLAPKDKSINAVKFACERVGISPDTYYKLLEIEEYDATLITKIDNKEISIREAFKQVEEINAAKSSYKIKQSKEATTIYNHLIQNIKKKQIQADNSNETDDEETDNESIEQIELAEFNKLYTEDRYSALSKLLEAENNINEYAKAIKNEEVDFITHSGYLDYYSAIEQKDYPFLINLYPEQGQYTGQSWLYPKYSGLLFLEESSADDISEFNKKEWAEFLKVLKDGITYPTDDIPLFEYVKLKEPSVPWWFSDSFCRRIKDDSYGSFFKNDLPEFNNKEIYIKKDFGSWRIVEFNDGTGNRAKRKFYRHDVLFEEKIQELRAQYNSTICPVGKLYQLETIKTIYNKPMAGLPYSELKELLKKDLKQLEKKKCENSELNEFALAAALEEFYLEDDRDYLSGIFTIELYKEWEAFNNASDPQEEMIWNS